MRRAFLAALLLLPVLAGAQLPSQFSARVDRQTLMVGERMVLELTLQGADLGGDKSLPYPQLDDHFVLVRAVGPNTQQSISIVNGSMTRFSSITMTLIYQARRPGNVTIPAVSYNAGGQVLTTGPITVEIVEPATQPAPDPGGGDWAPPTDPYIDAKPDRAEAYVGEQVVVSWYLYFQQPVSNPHLDQVPTAAGFMTQDLGMAQQLDPVARDIGGSVWQQAFLMSKALYPIQAGDAVLDPLVLSMVTGANRRGGFGFFSEPAQIASEPATIRVKPLPEDGKPAGFNGAVGEFQVMLSRAEFQLEVNTPFKFTMTVRGTGYPDFITKPVIKLPPEFDLYTDKVNKSTQQDAGRAVAIVEYSMIIVPHQAGEYNLGAFSMPYFDPTTGAYTSAQSQPIHLAVTPGRGGAATRPADQDGSTVASISQDLRYIKPDRAELDDGASLAISPIFLGGQAVPVLALAGAFLLRRRREKLAADPALARRLRAGKKSRDLLKAAAVAARAGNTAAAYDSAGRALLSFISDQWALAEQGLTTGDAVAALRSAGIAPATTAEVEKILSECDLARYAPGALPAGGADTLVARVEAAMKSLAREAK